MTVNENERLFGLKKHEWQWVQDLAIRPLKNHGARTWVFGSRARGDHKPFSDLDLLYECSEDLPKLLASEIQENLENSNLPIKVDMVDLKNMVEAYREGILKDRIEV